MKKDICIMCGNERPGLEVKEDLVIGSLRWIKKTVFRAEPKNYKLVVCRDCFIAYKKKRDRYERNQLLYVSLGIILMLMFFVFSSGLYLAALFYGIVIIVFMYLLAQLSYIPAVNLPEIKEKNKRNKK